MKSLIFIPIAFAGCFLFSCEPEELTEVLPGEQPLVSKEVHFDFETSAKISETTYSYNDRGLVELETLFNPDFSREVRTTYDSDGNVIRKAIQEAQNGTLIDTYIATEYAYENGLKRSEYWTRNGQPIGSQVTFFYTGNRLDSSRFAYYDSYQEQYRYLNTTYYLYDEKSRLVSELDHTGRTINRYSYLGNKLRESCGVYPADGGGDYEICVRNQYNAIGQLVSISEVSPGGNRIKEELLYKAGRLAEKKIYTYPVYEPGNTINITLVKYEYQ